MCQILVSFYFTLGAPMRSILLTFLTFFVFSFSAFADNTMPRTLAISASSETKVAPNIAYVTVAVTTQAAVAKDAVSQNAIKMNAVVDVLKKTLGTVGKFQTGNYQVNPTYQYDQQTRKSNLTGYEVVNQIRVETANLDGLGSLMDAVVAVGGNQIQSLQFGRTDMDALTTEATVAAIQKAKADAAKMAAGAGVTLGNILQVNTDGNGPTPVFKEMRMMAANASDAQTPVIPGEITVTGVVSIIFEIK